MKAFISRLYMLFIFSLLYVPILVLILYSFNDAKFSLQWQGFSLKWYQVFFQDSDLWQALFHSLFLGLSASIIATIIGLSGCIYLFLNRKSHHPSLFALLMLLIVIPDIVMGVSLLIFFNLMHIPLGFISLLIAHISFSIPFVILTIHNHIYSLDHNIYLSAIDLGASKALAIKKILLPLLMPAILSGFLLCFTLSFDDVIVSYFVAGPDFNILPLTIYGLVRSGVTPELNALCTLTFMISMILIIISHQLKRHSP